MTFGERLKELRNKKRWTQQEVANFIGMSAPGYVKVEQGQREFNFEKLVRVSECLCVSVDYLLKGDVEQISFGEKIKKLRLRRGLTQNQFAERLEVTSQVVSNYERDYREPEFAMLVKIATIFRVTTDYLLGYEVEK